jgi:hypothetical protein
LLALTGQAAATTPPNGIRIDETDRGVRIVYDLAVPATRLSIGDGEPLPPGVQIQVLEEGLGYESGHIQGKSPFRRATLLIEPDSADVDARYLLLSRVAGRGFVLYAPYILPEGPISARLSLGGGRYRALRRNEAEGGFVIVGASPTEGGSFRSITSSNSPAALTRTIHERAAVLLDFYRDRLGRKPPLRPVIFISHAERSADGKFWPFRGDVTPNGNIFLRFNGSEAEVTSAASIDRYTVFLAHELFHAWNRRVEDHPPNEAWLHEGAAEYFSWLAVSALWPQETSLERRVGSALSACALFYGGRALTEMTAGDGRMRYHCGAVAQWVADVGIRNSSGGRQDGFDLWARILARRGPPRDYSLRDFRAAAAKLGPSTSRLLDTLIDTGVEWDALAAGLSSAGADVAAGPPSPLLVRFAATRALVTSACGTFSGAGESRTRMFVATPPSCEMLEGSPTLERVGNVDPMAEPDRYYKIVRETCARRDMLTLRLSIKGKAWDRTVRCTTRVDSAPPELRVRRALPDQPRPDRRRR